MSDIFVPSSLNTADVVLSIAGALQNLVDPKERAKIADDIKAHHLLNDSQAKKHLEALALIKQHQAILDETKRVSEQNKKDAFDLSQKQNSFKQECESERLKISSEWSNVKTAAETAKNLHAKAEGMINDVAGREEALRVAQKEHDENVKTLEKEKIAVKTTKEKAEEIKRQHTELLEGIKAKQAAIAAFNI